MTDLKPVEELTFEEALEELEELTSSMASGEATLKESVAGYARGTALLKRCRRELEEARRTIETLRAESDDDEVARSDPLRLRRTTKEREVNSMTEASENDFKVWMTETARHFEWYADSTLPKPGREPRRLIGAMRYAVLGGGKRVRALLAYAAGAVSGASPEALDRAALALELVHAYSLVHDDMPSMDNDTLRRGKPTVHVQYGEATAMLAGDALQTEAFTVLAAVEPPAAAARLCATLARAAGVRGMCGGQALDLAMVGGHPGEAELLRMQAMKTGALIQAAVLCGAQAGDWDRLGDGARGGLAAYADALGVAFQVVDDILDCTQDTATLGKTAGKDEKDDKPTWVSLLGLEGARTRARELHDRANAALALVSADPAVPEGAVDRLAQIADYVIARSH